MTQHDAGLAGFLTTLRAFVDERDWAQFHDPKNLSMAVASEAGELVALYRWVVGAESDAWSHQTENRSRVEDEAADVGITLLLLCERVGIDLVSAMERKLEVNRKRYPAVLVRGRSERPSAADLEAKEGPEA